MKYIIQNIVYLSGGILKARTTVYMAVMTLWLGKSDA